MTELRCRKRETVEEDKEDDGRQNEPEVDSTRKCC